MNSSLSDVRILVAEDEETSRLVLCEMLSKIGISNCTCLTNGEDALQEFMQNPFDLVITDWNMQPMDGLALTWAIRKVGNGERAKTPIIMLTGRTDNLAVLKARQLGVSQFLAKPVTPADLASRVRLALTEPVTFMQRKDIYIASRACIPMPAPQNGPQDDRHVWVV